MKDDGHHIVVVIKEPLEVMKMLERVVLSEEMTRKKAAKKLMTVGGVQFLYSSLF